MVIREAYLEAAKFLNTGKIIEDSFFEARQLCAHVFGILPLEAVMSEDECPPKQYLFLGRILKKRLQGYPLQYLVRQWEFYGIELEVGPGVLIPRADSELLAERTIRALHYNKNARVLDLGSGSGCIAIAVKRRHPRAMVWALEISPRAVKYLERNISRTAPGITVIEGDLHDLSLTGQEGPFDVITANPPYLCRDDMENLQDEVKFEPEVALYGGEDGLDFYRFIAREYKQRLKPGGKLIFEIGIGQSDRVADILKQNGYLDIECYKDLSGIDRVIEAGLPLEIEN